MEHSVATAQGTENKRGEGGYIKWRTEKQAGPAKFVSAALFLSNTGLRCFAASACRAPSGGQLAQGALLFGRLLVAVVRYTERSKDLQMLLKNSRLKKAECQKSCRNSV